MTPLEVSNLKAKLDAGALGLKELYAAVDALVDDVRKDRAEAKRLKEVLEEIKLGKGEFSTDHHQHAKNTIEAMKKLAHHALEPKP